MLEKREMSFRHHKELLEVQLEIQERTLETIAQEIHDNVGQVLSLAKLNLSTLKIHEEQKLQDIKNLISKALNDLRDLSRSMHGDRILAVGLKTSIRDELQILENSGQFKTSLVVIGDLFPIDSKIEKVLFRVFQECLSNAIKHSAANEILVQLKYSEPDFTLIFQDDGRGFVQDASSAQSKGLGLRSLKNRCEIIGATLAVDTKLGAGTSVCVFISHALE